MSENMNTVLVKYESREQIIEVLDGLDIEYSFDGSNVICMDRCIQLGNYFGFIDGQLDVRVLETDFECVELDEIDVPEGTGFTVTINLDGDLDGVTEFNVVHLADGTTSLTLDNQLLNVGGNSLSTIIPSYTAVYYSEAACTTVITNLTSIDSNNDVWVRVTPADVTVTFVNHADPEDSYEVTTLSAIVDLWDLLSTADEFDTNHVGAVSGDVVFSGISPDDDTTAYPLDASTSIVFTIETV